MKKIVSAIAAAVLLLGPMAVSDPAEARHRHHARHYAKHYFKHYAHYPRYKRHYRHRGNRIVIRYGFGGCYARCGCW